MTKKKPPPPKDPKINAGQQANAAWRGGFCDAHILDWWRETLPGRLQGSCSEELRMLVEDCAIATKRALSSPRRLRPSRIAKNLNALAKSLSRSAKTLDAGGDQMLDLLGIVTPGGRPEDANHVVRHKLYLGWLSDAAMKAAELAKSHSVSMNDDHGGPNIDVRLEDLIAHLLVLYEETTGIRPLHTTNPNSGLVETGATLFVKRILSLYSPDGITFNPHRIDAIVLDKLMVRDLEYFEPPPHKNR